MKHQFSQVPSATIPRSSFNRSHGLKTVFDAGFLVPIFVDEVLPGDTFNLRTTLFGRLATPLKPVMDNLFLETFFFFIPNRLTWTSWQKFNGEQDNPGDSTDFVIPTMTGTAPAEGSLADHFGIPPGINPALNDINALPFRGYNLVWREWFRDQNLQTSPIVDTGDTASDFANYTLLRRGKRHDYFTSALPWPQKGDPVTVPLGEQAPIVAGVGTGPVYLRSEPTTPLYANLNAATAEVEIGTTAEPGTDRELYADLSAATGFTINELRQSFQIQKLLERDARGGTRYTEIVRSHFGVVSPDARLQRPEFLGGGTSYISMNPVAQTTQSTDEGAGNPNLAATPQGNLAAYGTVTGRNHGFTKSFTEHGYIIGLVNVRADLTYQQGLNRLWSRQGRYDYYWPALAHLGEQVVHNREIYVSNDAAIDDGVFAYQERYAEYRYKPSEIHSRFRSSSTATLDFWHLSQDFASLPTLSAQFIEDNPPVDRVIAVQTEPHMLLDCYFNLRCARPMPLYGVPGLIDHF